VIDFAGESAEHQAKPKHKRDYANTQDNTKEAVVIHTATHAAHMLAAAIHRLMHSAHHACITFMTTLTSLIII
jgi:hypothetical protein